MFVWRYLLFGCVLLVALAEAQKRNYSSFPCPKYCVCFRKTVRCMQLNFVQIPKVPFHTVLLDVRFNKISEIFPGTFKGHKNLRSLLLNDNLLTSLKNGVFTGLINLRHLYLYKNRIRYIESDVFQNLPKLEHLYLHSNALEEIKPGTFTNLPSLDRLFLYNNKIQRIPYGAIGHMQKLTRLRLDSNALVCDCGLAWLSKMLKDNNLHTAAHCRDPQEMYGKSLMSMEKSDFHCKSLEISEGPSDVEVTWGTEAVFTCRAEGDPQPTVVWMRDEQVLEYDGEKYSITDDGSLMIKNTDERDSGKYECMAKNADGEVKSRPARMVVKKYGNKDGNLKFITKPRTVTTTVGSEVRLECEATGNPKPIITWSRNGIILSLTTRHLLESNGNLIIRPIQQDDYGTYRCDAHNAFGRISTEAEVVLNAAPVFTIHPESANAQPGQTIKLECVAVGSPKPQITWYKEDSEIQKSDRVFISPDGSYLEIQNSKEDDSGTYVCEARNLIGYREVAAAVKVEALSFKPPKLLYKPYDVDALLGSTIELPCKADGNPTPGIQWRKDGSSLQRNGRTRVSITGNLYINGILPEDQGRYECSAQNEHGRDTASGFIRVKQDPHNSGIGIGDKFVKVAFVEASDEVDKAINKTIMNLFHSRGPHNSADLFRLIRYPNAPARELARAAEVYERTLVNIRKHVARGMSMNSTEDFNYRELLSPEHLNLVATLSGCMAHRYKRNCTDICFHSKYRSIDGMCNNFQNPTWGASLTAFNRILKPIYENGFSTPIGWDKSVRYYGHPKPPSRLVSTTLITTERITPDSLITHMVMQWGQFLDHDLDHAIPSVSSESWDGIDCKKSCDYAAPCYPIDVPQGDPRIQNRRCIDFVRSSAICGSGMTSVFFDNIQPREQINQLTSFIDASQVYGFSEELSNNLRDLTDDKGHLRKGHQHPGRKPLLPFDGNQGMDCRRNLSESSVSCFLAGDIRVNEQVGLIAMHTLWFREHNRVADELRFLNPHWNGETVYQEARKIIGAAMQHITYKQWLPLIIGEEGMKMLGDYKSYDPSINPSILNVFATAALRFGHTLINPILHRLDENFETIKEGNLELHKAFFSPWRVFDEGGIDPLLRGLYAIPAKLKKPQENLNVELTEKLFKSAHAVALDLAAINIHRSRDHAIPGYIEFRKYCNMKEVDRFEDLRSEISDPEVIDKLKKLYGHPGNIDVWVGGVLEDVVEGGKVGPLFRCLLVDQFRRLRDGDRFWYENPSTFKPEQLAQIKQYSLARVLCDSADNITRVTKNVFLLPERQGGYVDCKEVPKVDLGLWTQCCDDCRFGGSFNSVNRFNGRNRRQIKKDATCASTEALEQRISYLEGIIHNMTKTIEKIISS